METIASPKREAAAVYSASANRHYAGYRVGRILALTALGEARENYLADYVRRHIGFLTILLNPHDPRFTYDLRLISAPDPTTVLRGRVHIALLCRMDGLSRAEAQQYAEHLLHLLDAQIEECQFEAVPAEQLTQLLRPFELNHLAAITRRAGLVRLDTLRDVQPRSRMGFAVSQETPAAAPENQPAAQLLHLYSFIPTYSAINALFEFLLLARDPVAISCRLQPTSLEASEEALLEEGLLACEQAAQATLHVLPADLTVLRPTLQEQARLYQRHLARTLFSLRDNAALITCEAASPAPLPVLLLDLLGNLLTEPAGGIHGPADDPAGRYLMGGYEIVDQTQAPGARQAFAEMDLALPPHPLASGAAARLLHLFDSIEAMALFRFPRAVLDSPPGVEVQSWRAQPAPMNLPNQGTLLGVAGQGQRGQAVRIGREDRRRHCYVVGQTGTGKTTLLKTMILDDMRNGEGLCVIDPHGDLFHELLGLVPKERAHDVVVLDPTDVQRPVGLNMLEYAQPDERHFLVQEFVGIMSRLIEDEFGAEASGQYAGPIFYQHTRMNMLLAMSNAEDPGTLLEFHTIFRQDDYWRRWLPLRVNDPMLERWVTQVLPETRYTSTRPGEVSVGDYVASKFENFVFDPRLRNMFGQKHSTIDLGQIMNQGKILLVNLAKGELTDTNARFLGMVLLAKLQAAAMARVRLPAAQRREFYLYVDEFQNLATQNFNTLLSEARKFGVSLVLANQYVSQIKDPRIMRSIFGNVGTLICFRLGQEDAELMVRKFAPDVGEFDLINLPNWEGYMTTLVAGQASRPFSLQTVPAAALSEARWAGEVRELSRRLYGRARQEVEREIARSLASPADEVREKRRRGLNDLFGS